MMYKILIVEDQEGPIESLFDAITKVMAEELISEESYDLILLDHRMPYTDPKCTDRDKSFSEKCESIGYGLVPVIRKKDPKTLIIGTSSLDKADLRGYTPPDFHISKMWGEARTQLRAILEEKIKG